ncbi:MAG: NADP-dependent malic enzyme [Euryarchaeota archaeon]|nr:NADP-dependent malic enzyme [Euryarchaeota archaeon]
MEKFKKLLEEASKPVKAAKGRHAKYRGKIQILSKVPISTFEDFAVWYTPGVGEVAKAIHKNKDSVYEYTNRWNSVAIVSDGTRNLGLGDLGAEAELPVLEGKALLFKFLGGVDAFPLCIAAKGQEEIIRFVEWIKPSFGGINLEDIAQPKCFHVLDELRKNLDIPVWHDDQQGTATVTLAGLINALNLVGKKAREITVSLIGAGAANITIARFLAAYGVKIGNMIIVDRTGILHAGREELRGGYKEKWEMCLKSNREGRTGGIAEAMKGSDVCIAASAPGPGIIKRSDVASMASDAIIFALANPIPEIWPWEAKKAGARIVATGRSDFPNQINNSLGFPGIFRGALDVRAKAITDEMCIAAAKELARVAEEKGIHEKYIIPSMEEVELFPREAAAVAAKAMEQGIAGIKLGKKELLDNAAKIIQNARAQIELLTKAL